MADNTQSPESGSGRVTVVKLKEQIKEFKATAGVTTWAKWEVPGTSYEGLLYRYTRDVQGKFQVQDLIMLRNKKGDKTWGIRCPSRLQRILRDNEGRLEVGKIWLRITYTGNEATEIEGMNPPKLFDVEILGAPVDVAFQQLMEGAK